MRIQAPNPQPRGDGEYSTYVNGVAYGRPYGEITLDEGGALTLGDITLADARRLAAAAARVERELASVHARMTAPHGRRNIHKGTCQLCGKPENDGLHAEPAATAAVRGLQDPAPVARVLDARGTALAATARAAYGQPGDEPLPDCARCGHPEAGHRLGIGALRASGGMCLHAACDCEAYARPVMDDEDPGEADGFGAAEAASAEAIDAQERAGLRAAR